MNNRSWGGTTQDVSGQTLDSEGQQHQERGGGIPTVGGEGCRHAPGKNWGAPPDTSAGSDVRALARVRVQMGPANSTDLFTAIYHLFPIHPDPIYRR
ncbi:hypothetical protein QE416_000124 [Microbacterium sp. SORGH_AS 421]|nr:hypothetical protein [Microbacterium sp. SORGH_AS_0421]